MRKAPKRGRLRDLLIQVLVDDSHTTIRYNRRVALALPLDVGHTLPFFHDGPPLALRSFSGRTIVKRTHETAEPFQFSPAEPVVYATEL